MRHGLIQSWVVARSVVRRGGSVGVRRSSLSRPTAVARARDPCASPLGRQLWCSPLDVRGWCCGTSPILSLVRVHGLGAPTWLDFVHLPTLPPHESPTDGVLVRVRSVAEWEELIRWTCSRSHVVPVGVILSPDAQLLATAIQSRLIGLAWIQVSDVGRQLDLDDAVRAVLRNSTLNHLVQACRALWPDALDDGTLPAVVATGMAGGGVSRLAARLGLSRAGLYRFFDEAGLPPPGTFLRATRLAAVLLPCGDAPPTRSLLNSAGWFTHDAFTKSLQRATADPDVRPLLKGLLGRDLSPGHTSQSA